MGAASYGAANRIIALVSIPAVAIGEAVVTVCAYSCGARDLPRTLVSYRYALCVSITTMIVVTVVLALLAQYATAIFSYSPNMTGLREEIAHVIRLFCLFLSFHAVTFAASSLLQALRYARFSLFAAVLRNLFPLFVYVCVPGLSFELMLWIIVDVQILGAMLMATCARWAYRQQLSSAEESY
ncbi:MAG: MATE family efflux transporter [Candidatus Methanomethylophilus sp.]|nr:MATE family efflux transporter [Methanomethylophilus sp.]